MHSGDQSEFAPVVITGMGLATSLGRDADSTWAGIRQGRIGLGPMDQIESTLPDGAIGGQAMELPAEFAPGLPREARYLRWVIEHALGQASSGTAPYAQERCATILGTTLHGIRAGGRFLRTDDPAELKHFLAGAVTRTAIEGLGLEGLSATTCSACSSSLGAIALGVTMLESGQADLVIAGGYDAVSEYAWAGFHALRLVSPSTVMPFARQRQGMMLAEGYGVVVLERATDAARRGGRALVAVQGWGESADAHHLTQPDPRGTGAASAMRQAMARAGAMPADISMIAAHGTATLDNDAAEHAAFRAVFGDSLPATPVVALKSYLGHTLGGAGAVELILSACALRAGWVPPCATVRQEDVEFTGLTVAPPEGLQRRISRTLNTSLGFGGANTCVILGSAEHALAPGITTSGAASRRVPEVWITGYGLILPGITGIAELRRLLSDTSGVLAPSETVTDHQLAGIINVRRLRRLSTYVKLMLSSVSLALKHAGLEGDAQRLSSASAFLTSTHGSPGYCSEYYTQIVREGVLSANPVLFAEGVPNAPAAHVSTTFGIRGACQSLIGSRAAGLDAISLAAMRIRAGASDTVIVGAAEETHPSVDRAYRHFAQIHGVPGTRGVVATSGSVALVLESSVAATARGARPIARIGRAAGVSASRPISRAIGCFGEFDAPSRVLRLVEAQGAVLGSANGTWIDRAEAMAVQRLPGATLIDSMHDRVGDLFAAGPLLAIVRALAEGSPESMTSLCTDFTGAASAVSIEQMA